MATEYKFVLPLKDPVYYDIISSVFGQLSDGIWENSPRMEKYWNLCDYEKVPQGIEFTIKSSEKGYGSKWYDIPEEWLKYENYEYTFDENKFKEWLGNKVKQVVKINMNDDDLGDWNRQNLTVVPYLDRNAKDYAVTVADCYWLYEYLKGRKMTRNWNPEETRDQRYNRVKGEQEAKAKAEAEAKERAERQEKERKFDHIQKIVNKTYIEPKDEMRASDAVGRARDWYHYVDLLNQQINKITDPGKAIRRPVAFYKELLRNQPSDKSSYEYRGWKYALDRIESIIDNLNESIRPRPVLEGFRPRVKCCCALCGSKIFSDEECKEIETDDGTEEVCMDCFEENT